MGFSRQEYWSGVPFPPLGDLPNPGIGLNISCVSCIATGAIWEAPRSLYIYIYVCIYVYVYIERIYICVYI